MNLYIWISSSNCRPIDADLIKSCNKTGLFSYLFFWLVWEKALSPKKKKKSAWKPLNLHPWNPEVVLIRFSKSGKKDYLLASPLALFWSRDHRYSCCQVQPVSNGSRSRAASGNWLQCRDPKWKISVVKWRKLSYMIEEIGKEHSQHDGRA